MGISPLYGEYVAILAGCNSGTWDDISQDVPVQSLEADDTLYLQLHVLLSSSDPECGDPDAWPPRDDWFLIGNTTSPSGATLAMPLCTANNGSWQEIVIDYSWLRNYWRDSYRFLFQVRMDDAFVSRAYVDSIYLSTQP